MGILIVDNLEEMGQAGLGVDGGKPTSLPNTEQRDKKCVIGSEPFCFSNPSYHEFSR